VQLCGDAHVLNFGLWKTPERNLSFDLRDFDETLPGPFEWDVKRLIASLVVLARDHKLSAKVAKQSVCAAFRGYAAAIAKYAKMPEIDIWYDRIDVEDLVDHLAPYDADEIGGHIDSEGSGDAAAIAEYLGTSVKVQDAFVAFAGAYADQNQRDHAQFAAAVEERLIPSAVGW
jgi:hypothetical protein